MGSWPLWGLFAVFAVSGVIIWRAGVVLSFTTDAIDTHFGWGEGMGGAVLLAIATNLPEVAIIAAGAYNHDLSLAVGNILGGIAIQTVVLVLLDGPGLRHPRPLSSMVGSLTIVLQGLVLIAILMLCFIGALSPPTAMWGRTTPAELGILVVWIAGIFMVLHQQERSAWHIAREKIAKQAAFSEPNVPIIRVVIFFILAALATLVAGLIIAFSSEALAERAHLTGVVFGATILAAVTALPEVTTGLAAVRAGNYELAFADIVGGNAFLPVLFLFATLISGDPVLPGAHAPDLYLTALGALLTSVYCVGVILRSERLVLGAGIDSIIVFVVYICGIVGLFFVPS
ncbi:MAG: sodium:calcium antiporter [Candidatus Eremiobacteraeota bacterium]|nr:sodium:calcium antiporter [Candidatus Eremiobacteraeota bacterium]